MRLTDIDVISPTSLKEALTILHERSESIKPIAGSTDAIIQLKDGLLQTKELLDVSNLDELRYLLREGSKIRVGAMSTYSEIIESSVLASSCPMFLNACRTIGTPQIQSRGTIGGNLANASPAGDSIPPLYVLNATIKVQSSEGTRHIPIEKFFLGYRAVDLRPDELITEISFEAVQRPCDATFLKLGLRAAHFISLVNVAVWVRWAADEARFSDLKVAMGAVAPVVIRARRCEEFLQNRALTEDVIMQASRIASDEASPITDVRASAEYRRDVVPSLLYKAVRTLTDQRKAWEKP